MKENFNFVFFCRNRFEPVIGRATNSVAKIQAATVAIEVAGRCGISRLCIRTDSLLLINAVNEWMAVWKRNGWHEADGYPVENASEFRKLDAVMQRYHMQLNWQKVTVHSSCCGNHWADRLAKEGAKRYRN